MIQEKLRDLSIPMMLASGSALCMGLFVTRLQWSGSTHYMFMIWNLFLAWIPFLCTWMIKRKPFMPPLPKGFLLIVWLLFFPNAPYVITDLFHLKPKHNIPLWFDLVMLSSFAWNAMMLGLISLCDVHRMIAAKSNRLIGWTFVMLFILLCGFGVYLGRYERWNSWNVVSDPAGLFREVGDRFIHPGHHPRTIGVTVVFGMFVLMCYTSLYVLAGEKKPAD